MVNQVIPVSSRPANNQTINSQTFAFVSSRHHHYGGASHSIDDNKFFGGYCSFKGGRI
jgi:hypothetical protein